MFENYEQLQQEEQKIQKMREVLLETMRTDIKRLNVMIAEKERMHKSKLHLRRRPNCDEASFESATNANRPANSSSSSSSQSSRKNEANQTASSSATATTQQL